MDKIQENIDVEMNEEEILVEEGTEYREADIPDDDVQIGKSITSGREFEQEKYKLQSIIASLQWKIREIRSSTNYTSKYAVVRGGDDGTESIQLQSAKNASRYAHRQIEIIDSIIRKPYRYRVDIRECGKVKTYYLGPNEQRLSNGEEIHSFYSDWGRTLSRYDPKNVTLNNDILLRREFEINNACLVNYKNIAGTISKNRTFIQGLTDPFLIDVFKMRRADHQLRDIILTIQDNQNDIVYLPSYRNIIVQGCAGSGKTMVMMHRLSRIQNWEQDFDPREILIITPNDQYKMYMKALTEGLAISKITQLTMESLYQEILFEYNKEFYFKGKIAKECGINEEYISYIYSDRFKREFTSEIGIVLNERQSLFKELKNLYSRNQMSTPYNYDSEKNNFVEYMNILIERLKAKLDDVDYTIVQERYKQLDQLWERERVLKENINSWDDKEFSNVLQNCVIAAKKKMLMLVDYLDEERESTIRKMLKYESSEKSNDEVYNYLCEASKIVTSISDEVKKCDRTLEEKQRLQKELDDIPQKIELLLADIEKLEEENDKSEFKKALAWIEESVKKYSDIQIFREAYARVTERELVKLNMKRPARIHKYDLYARVFFCNQFYKKKIEMHKFVCVDEGQDLAINEYVLLYNVSKERFVINIYGDTNQTLNTKVGITDWTDLQHVFNGELYTLNENYRNSNQITRSCNKIFNMQVKEIGIDGPEVVFIKKNEFAEKIQTVQELENRRFAILIPRSITKKTFLKKIDNHLISADKISRKNISLLYVDEAKGFEFDVVYLWDEGMQENERYVAMTRAIEELIVMN